jgi:hypothetical protein
VLAILCALAALIPSSAAAGAVEIYLTPEEAPLLLFPEGTAVEKRRVRVDLDLRARLAERVAPARPSLWEGSIPTYVISAGEKVIGYAVVVNEIGKHRPITFVVGVTPEGEVRGVEIMVYREPKGGDVRMKRFLRQYRGKTLEAPLLTGRDIMNITGATLSVRAVNRGTKKALALVELVYRLPVS